MVSAKEHSTYLKMVKKHLISRSIAIYNQKELPWRRDMTKLQSSSAETSNVVEHVKSPRNVIDLCMLKYHYIGVL